MRHASILKRPVATAKSCAINFNENIKSINKTTTTYRAVEKYSSGTLNLSAKSKASDKIDSTNDI